MTGEHLGQEEAMSDERENAMTYIGKRECGACIALAVDMPNHKKETAKEVAKWIRSGLSVERVTVKEARKSLFGKCGNPECPDCRKLPRNSRSILLLP